MEAHSIYIHVPFCVQRCRYCDFTTYSGQQALIPDYVEALLDEIDLVSDSLREPLPVHTIYWGGGTPSLLDPLFVEKVHDQIRKSFRLDDQAEITLEANPGTVDRERLSGYRMSGVNRISLGMQSTHDPELQLLGRIHNIQMADQAYGMAREAGFQNINLDLIYGLPGQSLSSWEASLGHVIQLQPEHISLYALTLDEEVPLARAIQRGEIPELDDDLAADQYELAMDRLDEAGYRQYEISNWARSQPDREWESRHNLQYWHNAPYLGFGVAAHGYAAGQRTVNTVTIHEYLVRTQSKEELSFPFSPANATRTVVTQEEKEQMALMLGLRLTDSGVSRSHYSKQYGFDFYPKYKVIVDRLILDGLLEWSDGDRDILRLTCRGRLLGNQVFMHFVGDD